VRGATVSKEGCQTFCERASRHEKIPHYVDGQAIEHEQDKEK
jgi:hypothetical protein